MMAKTWLWLQLWLSIKPNLKCTQFGKFKKEYEDKIAEAEANIDGAVQARSKVQAVYDGLAAQKNELSLALQSGGSDVQDMIDKAVRIENQAADVQKDLEQVNARIKGEMITKQGKEKRSCADGRQKVEEDIQAAEDKCNRLSRVKGKLEQALDEAEDALEREKKVKGDVEKAKRKVEGDLEKAKR